MRTNSLTNQSEEGLQIREYLGISRRRWYLLIPLVTVWLLVWLARGFCLRSIARVR